MEKVCEYAPAQAAVREKRRFTLFGVEIVYLCVLGIGMAFIGWVAENAVQLITVGVWDCRFHMLPFIAPYALVVFAAHIAFGSPDSIAPFGRPLFKKSSAATKVLSNVIVIAFIYLFVFLGELAVGNVWEIISGVKLWDYSSMPFHVTQYAGLIPTLGYGTGAYLLFRFAYTPALRLLRRRMKYRTALIITCTLGALIVLDSVVMILITAITKQAPMYWAISIY